MWETTERRTGVGRKYGNRRSHCPPHPIRFSSGVHLCPFERRLLPIIISIFNQLQKLLLLTKDLNYSIPVRLIAGVAQSVTSVEIGFMQFLVVGLPSSGDRVCD